MNTRFCTALWVALVAVAGCDDNIDLDPLDKTPPVEARVRPAPIIGGTMELTADGRAVIADPDRDMIHVVDLDAGTVQSTITLEPGQRPARIALGTGSMAHVVLRGGQGIATIDLDAGTLTRRQDLCPDPRGIAYDDSDASLHVACADGRLFHLDEATGAEIDQRFVEPDLRDVVVQNRAVWTSTFRSATVIAESGERSRPDPSLAASFGSLPEPRVAWRTWTDARGRLVMLHQLAGTDPITLDEDEDVSAQQGVYGGGDDGCAPGLSDVAVSIVDGGDGRSTLRIPEATLSVDMALSPESDGYALAMPGAEPGQPSVRRGWLSEGCTSFVGEEDDDDDDWDYGQVTSVRYQDDGRLVMFSREPARILIQTDPTDVDIQIIELPGESVFDTGHDIFHRATESGLSCASCHPEGGDDGHTWLFAELGPRRTQPLDVGLAGTEPFHWDGDMQDMNMLMGEVLAHRMGGNRQSEDRRDSFKSWLFAQERPPANPGLDDPTEVDLGRELFASYGCGTCHVGTALGGSLTTEVRGESLQVPVLRRVSLRPPFMHDGRAATLEDAVRDMLLTTGGIDSPLQADVEALTAYMRSL